MVCSACGRVRPQGAANKPQADSTAIALMEMNLKLAGAADQMLVDSVQASGLPYVLDLRNYWYYLTPVTDGDSVKEGMRVEYSAVIRDLRTGALIEDVTEEVEVGKGQALRAIDYTFPFMRERQQATILAPYYNAYGRDGNEQVAPLTNVKVTLKVLQIERYETK